MNTNWQKSKKLSSNMEDYLEIIALLKKRNGIVRVRDISRSMSVKTPSVTAALNTLGKKGLIIHERYGYVEVTPEGKRLAQGVQGRHDILLKFLTEILRIDFKIAAEDACKMEHSISPQTFQKLTGFIKFVETRPEQDRPDWLKSFDRYFKTGKRLKCKVSQAKQKMLAKN
jgi:DtxR family Mn-dependent transcriptional regulator